jgi:uncharacterized protein (TIGR01619 family)
LSDDWDFYFARVDDAVSSIFVDLGVRADAPLENRPWLLWVWLQMQAPRPDGLSSTEESQALHAIGESLEAAVSALCGAQFVGRVTGNNRRKFYFYAAEPGEFDSAVTAAMKSFASYAYESGSNFEPDWDQYLNLLYPSDSNLQRMLNRRVLESLAEEGDVHEVPRRVEHLLKLPTEEARTACRDMLATIEFAVDFESRSEEEDDPLPFLLGLSRVDSVDAHSINRITLELARLAGQHGGEYDGWSCVATPAGAT